MREREPAIGTVVPILAALDLDWAEMTIDDAGYKEFLEQLDEMYRLRSQAPAHSVDGTSSSL